MAEKLETILGSDEQGLKATYELLRDRFLETVDEANETESDERRSSLIKKMQELRSERRTLRSILHDN